MPKSITWMKENEQPKIYTEEELQEAIDRTKEECALICEGIVFDNPGYADNQTRCAEAIRSKE